MTCSSTRPPSTPPPFHPDDSIQGDLVVVIGGGRFGERAAGLLTRQPGRRVWVVDRAEGWSPALEDLPARRIHGDGVAFLAEHIQRLADDDWVVPAVPVHLAAEWLLRVVRDTRRARIEPVPEVVREYLPHTWIAGDGSLLVSYADFLCPEDCPEPEDGCTVTGEMRTPLYEVFAGLPPPDADVHVIRSRQLAPGLGGYPAADLRALRDRVLGSAESRWLIGTACRCHGTLSLVSVDVWTGKPG